MAESSHTDSKIQQNIKKLKSRLDIPNIDIPSIKSFNEKYHQAETAVRNIMHSGSKNAINQKANDLEKRKSVDVVEFMVSKDSNELLTENLAKSEAVADRNIQSPRVDKMDPEQKQGAVASSIVHKESSASNLSADPKQDISDIDTLPLSQENANAISDTTTQTEYAPAVTHEIVQPRIHEVQSKSISRDIHETTVYHHILPIKEVETLPARHFIPSSNGDLIEVSENDLPKILDRMARAQIQNMIPQTTAS